MNFIKMFSLLICLVAVVGFIFSIHSTEQEKRDQHNQIKQYQEHYYKDSDCMDYLIPRVENEGWTLSTVYCYGNIRINLKRMHDIDLNDQQIAILIYNS